MAEKEPCRLSPGKDVRGEFPFYERTREDGRPFTYLDSAATSLKPRAVIDAVTGTLSSYTANVHRAVYQIGDEATELYEGARETVARFINAEPHEVVFLRNATEGLNLLSRSWKRDGRVLTSYGEHHSNLLLWGNDVARLEPLPDGSLDMDRLDAELAKGDVAMVTLSQLSNVTGILLDAAEVARRVHAAGAVFALDGAQSVPHRATDVKMLDCDFLVFSGHKMCAPTGIGVLYGKAEHLARLDWYLRGGQTVEQVHVDNIVPKQPPWKFEAGTPPIEAAAGLGAAIGFLQSVGMESIEKHLDVLTQHAIKSVGEKVPQAGFFGPSNGSRRGPVSLQLEGVSPHVVARALSDGYGICLRSGYHCAQPLHELLNSPPTLRASFYLYNTTEEIDYFTEALAEILSFHTAGTL